jgi:hypothetical protein
MFHPTIVEKRLSKLAAAVRSTVDPTFSFRELPPAYRDGMVARLALIWNPETVGITRQLTEEEDTFIRHEILRCKADFDYWLRSYCYIKSKHAELIRVAPTAVQQAFLDKIAAAELDTVQGKTGDGILFAVLKARQLGISTITECIIAYRTIFYGSLTALIASDVDDHTINLYEMLVRILEHLPWWMLPRSADPKKDYRTKNSLISFFDQDSIIRFASGKNMQGGKFQEKGSIGTGQTLHLTHISEFALWSNAEQIYDSLIPAIPMSPKTFGVIESTAKGRNNEWHRTWERAKRGLGRFKPIFFPYYIDPNDYRLPAPTNWTPSEHTQRHADRVFATSHKWVGHSVHLTRDQMFWYEQTYAQYKDSRMLWKLYAEYCADDLEAFQSSSQGVFTSELLEELRNQATVEPVLIDIRPRLSEHHATPS